MKIAKWMDPREDIKILTGCIKRLESFPDEKKNTLSFKKAIEETNELLKMLEAQKKEFEKEGLI